MDKLKYVKLELEDGSYSDNIPISVDSNNVEVTSRGESTNLANYVTSNDMNISNLSSQVNNNKNAIQGLASGSPKGVYTTINALVSANPDTGVYIVTADGHIYSWTKNGANAIDLGVYQSIGIANNTVTYDNLTENVKNITYREIHAEDLLWYEGLNIYLGTLTSDNICMTSSIIRISKNSSVTVNENYKVRISQFGLDKKFIRHTGAYAILSNPWIADRDCYIRISLQYKDNTHIVTANEITNDIVTVTGLVPITYGDIVINNLEFEKTTDKIITSKPIFLGKNTKIRFNDFDFTNSSGTSSFTCWRLGISVGNQYSNPESVPFQTEYITTADGFIKIKIQFTKGNTGVIYDITEDMIAKIKNNLEIEPTIYSSINLMPSVYVSSNHAIKIVKNYQTSGANLIRIDGMVVRNGNKVIADLDIAEIEEQLSSNIVEYESENYIKIPAYQGLFYNLRTNTLRIIQLNQSDSPFNTEDMLYLALNAWAFFFDGKIIDIYYHQQVDNEKIKLSNLTDTVNNNLAPLFNSSTIPSDYNWKNKAKEFATLFKSINSTNIESFLFFTDQHLMGANDTFDETTLITYINKLQKMYNSTPTSFIVSGGDWLNNLDTQENACFKLGYIDGFMNSMFKNYYPINGNHDTNYQGVINEGETWTGELPTNVQTNLSFRKYGKNYYKFNGHKSINYVLDCVKENLAMPAYKWEQIDWLATELLNDNPEHATIMMHIVWAYTDATTQQLVLDNMADNVTKLLYAYNNRNTITLNSITYNFTNATGHVDYVLSGHMHKDMSDIINGILCVATINFRSNNTLNYDLIINDYDNHKLRMIRVGTGSNREFDI